MENTEEGPRLHRLEMPARLAEGCCIRVPSLAQLISMAPSAEALDPFHTDSAALLGKPIFLRLKDFGWCRGELVERVSNRARKIGGVQINFIAKFDIDEGETTDLRPRTTTPRRVPSTSRGCSSIRPTRMRIETLCMYRGCVEVDRSML